MNLPQTKRSLKIIGQVIDQLQLDLNGLTVLTEVGSGNFIYTPVIAAMAGAKKVFAWTKDSRFGKANDIITDCREILKLAGIADSIITFVADDRPSEHIESANIITNSAHIRPLDKNFLQYVNPATTVIPLMYEKWELRESDIDIAYCKEKKIKVAGTWENHPDLKIFDFCEQLIIKMVFEAGYEISQNKIIIWSSDHYGELAEQGFYKLGAKSIVKISDIENLYNHIDGADFILFCDYMSTENLIGDNGIIDLKKIAQINPSLGIVHLCGALDNKYVKQTGLTIYPDQMGFSIRMTLTLAHLGLIPTLYLQAAGLKVGENLWRKKEDQLCQLIT